MMFFLINLNLIYKRGVKKAMKRVLYHSKPKPVKLSKKDKEDLIKIVESEIEKYAKLKENISRIHIRAGRIYFYFNHELTGDGPYINGLEKGDILEYIYGRITIFDNEYNKCSLDGQRHNDQWMELYTGTLFGCLKEAENNSWLHKF
jgi:hypothetical protein